MCASFDQVVVGLRFHSRDLCPSLPSPVRLPYFLPEQRCRFLPNVEWLRKGRGFAHSRLAHRLDRIYCEQYAGDSIAQPPSCG